jgi:hypothetical protein
MKKYIFTYFLLWGAMASIAQSKQDSLLFDYQTYLDFYYAYDFANPKDDIRLPFLVNYNRHNRMGLNMLAGNVSLEKKRYRAKLALQVGSFARDNYVNEPNKYLGLIQEANFGIALDSAKKSWLEIGVFPSHLGFESAIAHDNWALSRSLASELSPYYLSGAKLTYTKRRMTYVALLCNSWSSLFNYQKGQLPSFGTQIVFRKTPQTTHNWSTFIGSGINDGFDQLRIFNNYFVTWKPNDKYAVIFGLDLGFQKRIAPKEGYNSWFVPSLLLKRQITRDLSICGRTELFFDEFEVVTQAVNNHAFDIFGASANLDYRFTENGIIRLEIRALSSSGDYFSLPNGNFSSRNSFLIMALSKKF